MKKQRFTNTAKAAAVVTMGMTLVLGTTGIAQAGTPSRGHDATDVHGSQGGQHTAHGVHGVISAVSATSITVLGQGSAPTVLAITSATKVFEGATTATPAGGSTMASAK